MKSFIALLHCASLFQLSFALATPSVSIIARKEEVQNVALHIKIDKAASQTRITIAGQHGEPLAETCSSTLDSGPFADFVISAADLDENGAGNLTFGPNILPIRSDPKSSNGLLTCTRMFDNTQAFVNCKAVLPASIRLSALSKRDACFNSKTIPGSDEIEHDLERISLIFTKASVSNNTQDPTHFTSASIMNETEVDAGVEKRQCGQYRRETRLLCDGDPRQVFFHQQLSERKGCDAAPECSVSAGSYKSVTKGWEASASIAGWISGGWAIQTSIESGNEQTCTGYRGDEVCVWKKFAHTSLRVQDWAVPRCGGAAEPLGKAVLTSPNVNNRGGRFYCVVGACRSIYDNYWEEGFPGGPR